MRIELSEESCKTVIRETGGSGKEPALNIKDNIAARIAATAINQGHIDDAVIVTTGQLIAKLYIYNTKWETLHQMYKKGLITVQEGSPITMTIKTKGNVFLKCDMPIVEGYKRPEPFSNDPVDENSAIAVFKHMEEIMKHHNHLSLKPWFTITPVDNPNWDLNCQQVQELPPGDKYAIAETATALGETDMPSWYLAVADVTIDIRKYIMEERTNE